MMRLSETDSKQRDVVKYKQLLYVEPKWKSVTENKQGGKTTIRNKTVIPHSGRRMMRSISSCDDATV